MNTILSAIKYGLEDAPKSVFPIDVTGYEITNWYLKAYSNVINDVIAGYNHIFGVPTTFIQSTEEALGDKKFASQIIVYKEKRILVYFDRMSHYVIPFDAISSCHPLDLSQHIITGGG